MADCRFGTMDWYCALQEGHAGPHESHPLPVDSAFSGKPAPASPIPPLIAESAMHPANPPASPVPSVVATVEAIEYMLRDFDAMTRHLGEFAMGEHLRAREERSLLVARLARSLPALLRSDAEPRACTGPGTGGWPPHPTHKPACARCGGAGVITIACPGPAAEPSEDTARVDWLEQNILRIDTAVERWNDGEQPTLRAAIDSLRAARSSSSETDPNG